MNSGEDSSSVSTPVLPSIFSPDSPWKTRRHELLRGEKERIRDIPFSSSLS